MITLDTNVLVYRFDRTEPQMQSVARSLMREVAKQRDIVLLWQVAGEFLSQLTYWHHQKLLRHSDIVKAMRDLRYFFPVAMPTSGCIDKALDLRSRYSLSHWDSMLLAACLDAAVVTLYTEDMGAPRKIDSVELINPFAG